MKLLTVAIPCYNSESYMEHCINTLLTGGEEVEIIIVDDGSAKDRTGEIADRYAREYPTICRAIHQENGGHGEAVNTGLKMPRAYSSRWWTVTTGSMRKHMSRFLQP